MDALVHGEPLIQGRGVCLKLGNRVILDSVDVDVMPGEIVTVIGPNGAGKSSLVRVLLGLQAVTGGRVVRKNGLRIGYVPQRFPLTPNVPLDVRRLLSLTLRAAPADIEAALTEPGIAHLKEPAVALLSGGELQRALPARAFLPQP